MSHRSIKTYLVELGSGQDSTNTAFILEAFLCPSPWNTNPATTKAVLSTISERSSIPVPSALLTDETRSIVSFDYLLLSFPDNATVPHKLDLRQELRLGTYLKQLHQVDNDWFGTPGCPSDVISWQEAFTALLENLLESVEGDEMWKNNGLMGDLRKSLSRAIGFYLFDDVEVPSLIWFTGDEEAVLVTDGRDRDIALLFGFSFALWGDPLLETMFMSPSRPVLEGYEEKLIVFPRQRTKRTWYTLFLALLVMVESEDKERVKIAKVLVEKCVETLKNAPCY